MENAPPFTSGQRLRLYRDLADWYPLLTPVGDYAEEAAFYRGMFEKHAQRLPRTLLDLGSGAGHNAAYLKETLACTLLDLEPAMLACSRQMNPECEHVQGDMRTTRLGRVFDCVLVQDAVNSMTSRDDLERAMRTAYEHTAPGGVALFHPDYVEETFKPGTDTGGSDGNGRGLRYLEWRWRPDSRADLYVADMAYLLKEEDGTVEAIHDRHLMGLFPRAAWLERMAAVGFDPLVISFPHECSGEAGREVFLGTRPVASPP
ncbi:class I SAM-dependent methyltransferase [Pararhodospirillum oryzae]|uniref:Methyltransferase type 11 n=1 Tax=Pararhodospirillum oryzae TaxID=478448 RepID=A0A512HBX2_9PROT|nr:class I SAM-dependent methyltransferase [Pararhodospirillum oryzae]GEO82948.1 methyltransferase type 11 [Pararhodospirillum oryzae]